MPGNRQRSPPRLFARRSSPWVVSRVSGDRCGKDRVGANPSLTLWPNRRSRGVQRRTSPANHKHNRCLDVCKGKMIQSERIIGLRSPPLPVDTQHLCFRPNATRERRSKAPLLSRCSVASVFQRRSSCCSNRGPTGLAYACGYACRYRPRFTQVRPHATPPMRMV